MNKESPKPQDPATPVNSNPTAERLNNEFYDKIAIFESHLKNFATSLVRDPYVANDLFQNTIFRALKNREKFNTGTNLKAWLFTIMKNAFINDYRKDEIRNKVRHTIDYDVAAYKIKSNDNTESSINLKFLNEIINSIEEDNRIPFLMHFEGFKYQEIADELNLPMGTVKSRIFFARKKLKKILETAGYDESKRYES